MPDQEKMDAFAELRMLRQAIKTISPDDHELAVIDDMLAKLYARQYTVAVVGEFNRGKSSLINALLGMQVLPADITPTTATINRVVYSETPCVHLLMRDGHTENIPMTLLKERVTKISREAQTAAEAVKEAEIGYPTVFCKNNVAILDTPGLNDCEAMDALTFDRMDQVDALIYAIHALVPFSDSEANAVCRLLVYPNIRHILFTVGFIDQIPEEERARLLDVIRKRIVRLVGKKIDAEDISEEEAARRKAIVENASVMGISAKLALDAFVNGSEEQLHSSGIEAFKKALMARLTAEQDEWLSYEIVPYLQNQSAAFGSAAQRTLDAMDARIEKAGEQIKSAKTQLEKLLTDAEQAGNDFRRALTLEMGSRETLSAKLRQMILEKFRQTEAWSQETNPERKEAERAQNASKGGFFAQAQKWIKEKAKEKDLFREANDPQILGLDAGIREASAWLLNEWIPEYNRAAVQAYPALRDIPPAADRCIRNALSQALEVLETKDIPLPGTLNVSPDTIAQPVLFTAEELESLRQTQPGNLKIGKPEWIAQREADALANRVAYVSERHIAEAVGAVIAEARALYGEGIAQAVTLEAAVENLKAEKDALKAQIAATRKMFAGSGEEEPQEAGDAPVQEETAETDTNSEA